MVMPAQRWIVAAWAESAYQVSQRRACRAAGVCRSLVRYQSRRASDEPLRRRLREMAGVRAHAGYRQLHVYLKREGWRINHKRLYRLYVIVLQVVEGLVEAGRHRGDVLELLGRERVNVLVERRARARPAAIFREEAATKLLYLALVRAEQRWTMPIKEWKNALNQLAVHFDGRLPI